MEIIVFGKNIQPTQALRQFTEEKVLHALQSVKHVVDRVKVILSKEKEEQVVKVQCNIGKRSLAVQENDDDMYNAVSQVVSHLNKRVVRETEKRRKERRRATLKSTSFLQD